MGQVLMDREEVKAILPHREPMLLVDRVTALEAERVETEFYVRPDWDIFRGHFPAEPVFPGVLAVECMAQAADVLMLSREEFKGKTPLFAGIESARFYRKIKPGDTVTAQMALLEIRPEKQLIRLGGQLLTDGEKMASAEILIAMR